MVYSGGGRAGQLQGMAPVTVEVESTLMDPAGKKWQRQVHGCEYRSAEGTGRQIHDPGGVPQLWSWRPDAVLECAHVLKRDGAADRCHSPCNAASARSASTCRQGFFLNDQPAQDSGHV